VAIRALYLFLTSFSVVGIGLGIAGLCAKDEKKIFAILRLLLSTF
jgi:hypothetical protein